MKTFLIFISLLLSVTGFAQTRPGGGTGGTNAASSVAAGANVTVVTNGSVYTVSTPGGSATNAQPPSTTLSNLAANAYTGYTNAPASSTSLGRGMSNLLVGRKLFVDMVYGTNATAIPNDISKAYRDTHWAYSNAVYGDVVQIGPGTNNIGTNHLRGKPGVTIRGSSSGVTVLMGTGGLLTEGPVIGGATDQGVQDITLHSLQSGNTFGAGWGSVSGINSAFTNATLINVKWLTGTDGVYVNQTGQCSGVVYSPIIDSRWDCWLQDGNSNHFFEIFDPNLVGNNYQPPGGPYTNTANAGAAATGIRNLAGTLNIYGGSITATNGEFDGTFAVYPDNSGVRTNITRLYGVRLVAAGTNDTARINVASPITHGFVYEHAGEEHFTQPTAGTYTAGYFDGVVSVTNAVSRTITLPDIAPAGRAMWDGLRITIHDKSQLAATTNIFISASGNQRINGAIVTTNINCNGCSKEFIVMGTNWFEISPGLSASTNFDGIIATNTVAAGKLGATNLSVGAIPYVGSDGLLRDASFVGTTIGFGINSSQQGMFVASDSGYGLLQVGGDNITYGGYYPGLVVTQKMTGAANSLAIFALNDSGTSPDTTLSKWVSNGVTVAAIRMDGRLMAQSIEASNSLTVGTGNGTMNFSTNHFKEGVPTLAPSVERQPTNANSGVAVWLPVAGITNQQVHVPLTNGQTLSHDGTNYVAVSLASAGASTMTQTNFVLNQVYTNTTTRLITVRAFLTQAAVNGVSSVELMWSPSGGIGWTNLASAAMSTLLTGLAAQATNSIAAVMTNLGSFYFTNTSSGDGNSAGLVAGTGQITTMGVGPAGATGATGAAGEVTTTQLLVTSNYIVGASNQLPLVYQTNLANGMSYEAFPVAALDGKDVVMVYSRATAHVPTNSSLWMTRTKNAGLSWETPFLARTNEGWDICAFAFGVGNSGRYHLLHMMRSITNGTPGTALSWYSNDKGTNWTAGGALPVLAGAGTNVSAPYGRIISIGNNRLLANYFWISNDLKKASSAALTSDDDGVTWVTNDMQFGSTYGVNETSFAYLGGSNVLGMVRTEDAGGSTTNRFFQMVSTNNAASWNLVGALSVSLGIAASASRCNMEMHTYRDPVDGLRIVAVTGDRVTAFLVRRDVSAKRVWDAHTTWNNVIAETIERGAIGTVGAGGYGSPIWLSDKSEVICPYYHESSSTAASIRFLQLPPR